MSLHRLFQLKSRGTILAEKHTCKKSHPLFHLPCGQVKKNNSIVFLLDSIVCTAGLVGGGGGVGWGGGVSADLDAVSYNVL